MLREVVPFSWAADIETIFKMRLRFVTFAIEKDNITVQVHFSSDTSTRCKPRLVRHEELIKIWRQSEPNNFVHEQCQRRLNVAALNKGA